MHFNPGVYRHYNGGLYQAWGVGRHSETLEEMIVCQHLDESCGLWVRPRTMFEETVTIDGKTKPRFEYVGPTFSEPPKLR